MSETLKTKRKIYKCEHGRIKCRCRECGGGSFCEHDKRRSDCRECGGGSICEHDRQRSHCRECGGGSICEHDRIRSNCRECGGGSICEHDRLQNYCRECGGTGICKHNKRKTRCKECGGIDLCKHDIHKAICRECDGREICKHNIHRTYCKECGGGSLCKHDIRKFSCKECGGGGICKHNKIKYDCRICDSVKHPENWCKLCKFVNVRRSSYSPYCFNCYCVAHPDENIKRQFKLKEHHLRDELKELYPDIKMEFDKKVDDGCSLRRPDVRIECFTHTIIIECDENMHQNYSCENKRIMEIFQDLGNRPIVFLRFNPDKYKDKNTGDIIDGCFNKTKTINNSLCIKEWTKRITLLKERIDYHYINIPLKEVIVEHLFYE